MESHFATEAAAHSRRRTLRAAAIQFIGPLTMLVGVAWGFLQPYRLTIHVVLVGLGFAVFIAPALIDDLEEAEDAAEG